MADIMNALEVILDYIVNAGVPVALLAGLFPLWQIAINHRRVLEQQREKYRYDLILEIYSELSDRIQEAFKALIQASSTATTLSTTFNSLEKQFFLLQKAHRKVSNDNSSNLSLELISRKREEAEKFARLHYLAGEAVIAVIFALKKYQVALPKSAKKVTIIGKQWDVCHAPSDELNTWAVQSFSNTTAEEHTERYSETNPGLNYKNANMEVGATLESLLEEIQKELVGELFQDAITARQHQMTVFQKPLR